MSEHNMTPEEMGMSLEAQKFEATKGKINLSYAKRIISPPEYEGFYSGVCDVDSPEAARSMAEKLRESRKDSHRKIMIGVMTHPIVLDPDIPVPKKVREEVCAEFPDKEEIAAGFTDDPDVLNTIHYADLYGPNGPWKGGESPDISKNLEFCVKYGGENLHAIQLDVTWPNAEEVKSFKEKHPNISIILQVGKYALNEAENDPQNVANKLREYGDSIDFALLDLSMGKGRKMEQKDIRTLLQLLSLIQYELPNLGLAVAGGFGRESEPGSSPEMLDPMDALKQIADEFPSISIDAQGGLKPADAPKDHLGHFIATTPADTKKAEDYIMKTASLLDEKKSSPEDARIRYIRV